MKKILILLFTLSTILFANIGKISAASGEINVDRGNDTLKASSGFILQTKDIVRSSANSKAQIIFSDETVVTIGQNAILDIAEFVYDLQNPANSKANIGFMEGTFKNITGNIGKVAPKKFNLKTKSASIGIRGTIIVGDQTRIAVTEGEIEVTAAGVTQIVGAGMMTNTQEGQPPSAPEPLDEIFIQEVEGDTFFENDPTDVGVSTQDGDETPPQDSSIDETTPEESSPDMEITADTLNSEATSPTTVEVKIDTTTIAQTIDDVDSRIVSDTVKSVIEEENSGPALPSNYFLTGFELALEYPETLRMGALDGEFKIIPISQSGDTITAKVQVLASGDWIDFSSDTFTYNPSVTYNGYGLIHQSNIYDDIMFADSKGEFFISIASTPDEDIGLMFFGKDPTMSNLKPNSIYKYNILANMSTDLDFTYNLQSEGVNGILEDHANEEVKIFLNTRNYNMTLSEKIDTHNNYGTYFSVYRLNPSDGTINGKGYRYEQIEGSPYNDGVLTATTPSSLYGSDLQGIALYEGVPATHAELFTGYLSGTPVNNSAQSGTLAMTGVTHLGSSIEFEISKESGNFDITSFDTNGWILGGATTNSAFESYYIDDQTFGSIFKTTNSGTLTADSSWFFTIPDTQNGQALEDDISWGYWTATIVESGNNHFDKYSTWIAGIETAVGNLPTSGTDTFTGNVIGQVTGGDFPVPILMNDNNSFSITIEYGVGITSGHLNFEDSINGVWNTTLSGGGINGNQFGANVYGTNITGSLDGQFYGDGTVKGVGGSFNINGFGNTAKGVFRGVKQ